MGGQECAGPEADAQRLGPLHAVQETGSVALQDHQVSGLAGRVRYLGPREVAPSHRQGALRFVVDGEGV
ncbi:hypothetical protein AQJ84_08150 [Streptomyces resistomycificus]|uniref:Uncharacterized protein n=1 Tax=Streptomyces resistomycificus TaxID=67356 RepID=A0A0L8L5S5_9ACTN|nr:hypothetical protein ADK37_22495 [Streptomyces resistomycificus]KUO00937.1 hypothetical protein AQJ84_08150 [Streptomyces resistomycificus]